MSTRSKIGMVAADGSVLAIYCHHDGYLSGVGQALFLGYSSRGKVECLMALGDLSVLGVEIGDKHDFNDEHDPMVCTAYGRDRGEEGVEANRFETVAEFCAADYGHEYTYLFTADNVWKYLVGYEASDSSKLRVLTQKVIDTDKE